MAQAPAPERVLVSLELLLVGLEHAGHATAAAAVRQVGSLRLLRARIALVGRFNHPDIRAAPAAAGDPGAVMAGTPHLSGTREYFSCLEGAVSIFVAGDRYDLVAGDVLAFPGNVPHSYRNPGNAAAMGISVVILAKAGV